MSQRIWGALRKMRYSNRRIRILYLPSLILVDCDCRQCWLSVWEVWEGVRLPVLSWQAPQVHALCRPGRSQVSLPFMYQVLVRHTLCIHSCTRAVQNVRKLTQLITRYLHHILSLFNIVSCAWNALRPAFPQSSDSVVEGLLIYFTVPAIAICSTVFRKFVSFREFLQFTK